MTIPATMWRNSLKKGFRYLKTIKTDMDKYLLDKGVSFNSSKFNPSRFTDKFNFKNASKFTNEFSEKINLKNARQGIRNIRQFNIKDAKTRTNKYINTKYQNAKKHAKTGAKEALWTAPKHLYYGTKFLAYYGFHGGMFLLNKTPPGRYLRSFIICGITGRILYVYTLSYPVHIKVEEKYRRNRETYFELLPGSDEPNEYMIYDTNQNLYNVRNSRFWFQYYGPELYSGMKKEHYYLARCYGVRLPWLKIYPIIVHAWEIDEEEAQKPAKGYFRQLYERVLNIDTEPVSDFVRKTYENLKNDLGKKNLVDKKKKKR